MQYKIFVSDTFGDKHVHVNSHILKPVDKYSIILRYSANTRVTLSFKTLLKLSISFRRRFTV